MERGVNSRNGNERRGSYLTLVLRVVLRFCEPHRGDRLLDPRHSDSLSLHFLSIIPHCAWASSSSPQGAWKLLQVFASFGHPVILCFFPQRAARSHASVPEGVQQTFGEISPLHTTLILSPP